MTKRLENRISSREVAEMMEMDHPNLLKKIDSINEDFRKVKIDFSKYWIESAYKVEGQTRNYREFLITKKGCEFLAHKTTGTKGNLFTDKYMDKFEAMENMIKQQPLDNELTTIDKVFGLLQGTNLMGAIVQAVVNVTVEQRVNTLNVLNEETKRVIIEQLEQKNIDLSNEGARIWKEFKDNQAVIDMLGGSSNQIE